MMSQIIVFGGPFAGKTTLHRYLMGKGVPVYDREEAMRAMPDGIEVLKSWPKQAPRHEEFLRRYALTTTAARHFQGVVILHDPAEWAPAHTQLFLHPGYEELANRMAAYVLERGQGATSHRLYAALDWWSKAAARNWATVYRVATNDNALEWIAEKART